MNHAVLDSSFAIPRCQLGFKMVKWIQAIEFVTDVQSINNGEGGYAEGHEYIGELANI